MADLFWAFSTSYFWLSLIGTMLLAALILGYFPLAKYLPVIGPYIPVAKLIAFLLFGLLAFLVGHRIADESADLKQAKQDLAFSQLQLNAQKASADEADKLREQAEADAQAANQKVKDYEAKLASQPVTAGCDLDNNDVDSLRGIAR